MEYRDYSDTIKMHFAVNTNFAMINHFVVRATKCLFTYSSTYAKNALRFNDPTKH